MKADRMLSADERPWITALHVAEWVHAIAQHVFHGQMTGDEAARVRREFDYDRTGGLWETISVPDTAFDVCADLGRLYGPKLGIRTLDSLRVACALELKAERFWTFDDRQLKLATAVGLKTR